MRGGVGVDPATWTRRARTGSTWVDDLVDPGRALTAFASGDTIVLQSLQRWWPPVTRFCAELDDALGHRVQANAYLSPAGTEGLAAHHDSHDVFVLQAHGTKHWVVREPLIDAPLERHRSAPDEAARAPVAFEADLGPGDCLYLPRGWIHSASAPTGVSLHLTIGVLSTTAADVVRRLADRAVEQVTLRRTLPPSAATDLDAAHQVVKDVVGELVAWLESVDPTEVAEGLVASTAARRAVPVDGWLLDLAALDSLSDASVVQCRPRLRWSAAVAAGRLRLDLRDRVLDLPATLDGPVQRLLDGSPHAIGELADVMDAPSRSVLARRLVRDGALRIVDGA